jgi:hypothetical protein
VYVLDRRSIAVVRDIGCDHVPEGQLVHFGLLIDSNASGLPIRLLVVLSVANAVNENKPSDVAIAYCLLGLGSVALHHKLDPR